MSVLEAPTIAEIRAARDRLDGVIVRTPLIRLNADGLDAEVWIKLENLQPIGSFKLRGAANAMRLAGPEALRGGVYTAVDGVLGGCLSLFLPPPRLRLTAASDDTAARCLCCTRGCLEPAIREVLLLRPGSAFGAEPLRSARADRGLSPNAERANRGR
jgi:hypothetical protein